jgi:hypothetical protein
VQHLSASNTLVFVVKLGLSRYTQSGRAELQLKLQTPLQALTSSDVQSDWQLFVITQNSVVSCFELMSQPDEFGAHVEASGSYEREDLLGAIVFVTVDITVTLSQAVSCSIFVLVLCTVLNDVLQLTMRDCGCRLSAAAGEVD